MKKGLIVFIVVSILAMACILIWTTHKETWKHILDFRLVFVPVLLGLSALRWFLDGMTLRCMADKKLHPTLSLKRATVIRLEGNMVANVLPFFFGIFSAHAYLLHKEKMTWSESTAVSMMRAVIPVMLFLGSIPILFFMRSDPNSGMFFERFVKVVSVPVAAVVVFAVVTLFYPQYIKKLASKMIRGCGRIKIIHADKILEADKRLSHEIGQFSVIVRSYFHEKKYLLLRMAIWILLTFVIDAFVALSILWSLGYTSPVWHALSILYLLWPIAYLVPVPGGAGVLEFSYLGFFSLYMPQHLTGAAVLMWRLLLTYLPSGAGVYYLIREIKNDPKLERLLQGKEKVPTAAVD